MQKLLLTICAVITLVFVSQIVYSSAFEPEIIRHYVTYHGKYAQWVELVGGWQMSKSQFIFFVLFIWVGVPIFYVWALEKVFDSKQP